MQKQKVLAIAIIAIFMFQMVSQSPAANKAQNKDEVGTQSATNPESQVVDSTPTAQKNIPQMDSKESSLSKDSVGASPSIIAQSGTQWQQGETVRADVVRKNRPTSVAYTHLESDGWWATNLGNALVNDNANFSIKEVSYQPSGTTIYDTFDVSIKLPYFYTTPFTFSFQVQIIYYHADIPWSLLNTNCIAPELNDGTVVSGNDVCFQKNKTSSLTITDEYVNNGQMVLRLETYYKVTGTSANQSINFDTFIASFPPSIDYIHSQYKSISDNTVHQISVQNFDYGNDIAIFAPLSWNLTSMSPTAPLIFDPVSNSWNISYTVPTTYTFTFVSGSGWGVDYERQPYILAIDEYSSYSFEGS